MAESLQASQTSDTLNESWVQLNNAEQEVDDDSVVLKSADGSEEGEVQAILTAASTATLNQHLLKKAQFDNSSLHSAGGSSSGSVKTISINSGKTSPLPQTPKWEDDLPVCDVLENSERVWDWASRPELIPPPGFETKMFYPGGRRTGSVYNRYGQKTSVFSWDNLPQLLLSHATAFLIGAAAAFAFSRLKSAASYGSVMIAASDVAALGTQSSSSLQQPISPPLQLTRLSAPVESSTRSGIFVWDRIF